MNKEEKITKDFYDSTLLKMEELNRYISKLEDRLDYVLQTYFELMGKTLKNWYFDGANEGEVGSIVDNVYSEQINSIWVDVKFKNNEELVIIDKFGKEFVWENSIPFRWLFEDFEQEVIDGKVLFEAKEKKLKEKKTKALAAKKIKKAQLIESAKNKLSKEELAALKKAI